MVIRVSLFSMYVDVSTTVSYDLINSYMVVHRWSVLYRCPVHVCPMLMGTSWFAVNLMDFGPCNHPELSPSPTHPALTDQHPTHKQVYPIGIPLAFGVMLWKKRRLINPAKDSSSGTLNPNSKDDESGQRENLDPRFEDRRIGQTAFLWRVSINCSVVGVAIAMLVIHQTSTWCFLSYVWHVSL